MKRLALASLVLMAGLVAHADEWTQMSSESLATYKQAANTAWNNHVFSCSGTLVQDGETIQVPDINSDAILANINDEAAVGFTNAEGTQPPVYFSTDAVEDGVTYSTAVYMYGDATLATVSKVTAHQVVKSGEIEQVVDVICE